MPIVGGLDMHRKQITFDYLGTVTGQVQRGQVTPADREHLRAWLARFAGREDVAFAAEGCTGWRYVTEELAAAGIAAHLAEPAGTAFARGRKRHAKTDKTDCRHLRTLLAEGQLPECWIPPARVLECRALLETYHDLRREHTAGFLSVPGTLTATHEAKGTEAAFAALHARTDMVLTGSASGHVARLPLADQAGAPGVRARLHDGPVVALAAPGNQPAPAIVSLGEDRRVVRWPADPDETPGQSGHVRVARVALAAATTAKPDGSLSVVTIDDEGRTVIWAARDGQLDIDRAADGGPRGEPVGTVTADGGYRGSSQVALSPAAATGTRRPVRGSHQAIAAARSPGGLTIVTVSTMGAIRLHQLADGETEPQPVAGADGQQLVTAIAAAPAGDAGLAVATGSAEGSIEVWAVESGQFVPVCPVVSLDAMDLRLGFVSGQLSGEAHQLITGDARGDLQLLAIAAGTLRPLAPPWHHRNVPLTAVAARRGQVQTTIAAGTLDGEVAFWTIGPAGSPTWLTSVHLGSRVLGIGLGDRADVAIWCRNGAVTLTHISGLAL